MARLDSEGGMNDTR